MAPKSVDRQVTTCRACRRRKVRCDRQRPICTQCRASNVTCMYEGQGQRSYHFIHETPSGSSGTEPSGPSRDETDTAPSLAVPEQRIATLELKVKSLSDLLSTLQQSSSGGISPLPVPANQTAVFGNGGGAYLSDHGGGKMRYVNASSWSAMCRDVAEIDDILYAQAQEPSTLDDENHAPDNDESHADDVATRGTVATTDPLLSPENRLPSRMLESFWAQFPPREFCNGVLRWYFCGYHPLVPLVHIPSFRMEYEQFWSRLDDHARTQSNLPSFTVLLLSFLYAGCVAGGEQPLHLPGLTPDGTIAKLYRLTSRALKLAKFPHAPTLDTLRAYLVLKSIQMREEEPLSSVAFVGLSLRVANILGLHKDPKHFPQFDSVEAEVRRRVWWQLVHIDVCVAVAAGLPPLIDLQSWDVQPLSELKDELIGTSTGVSYANDVSAGNRLPDMAAHPMDENATSMVSTSGILAASKYQFTIVQRRFFSRLEKGAIVDQAPEVRLKLDELGARLQQAVDRIPDISRDDVLAAGLDSPYGSALALNKWARLLISTYQDQRLCLLSYPLRSVPGWPGWDGLHAQAMEASMSFTMKCARLSSDTIYRRFQWSWPGNHQPLHALALLLCEVLYSPDSPYAERIRTVVDIIVALASEQTGLQAMSDSNLRVLANGGSEAWKYLHRLRARAWRKKDWSPAVPFSHEQAARMCQTSEEETTAGEPMPSTATHPGEDERLAGMSLETPITGLFGDGLLYSGDVDLPDFTSEIGFETWIKDL